MAKIDSAYDYYVSVYGNQTTSRYDSHKKSDLRKVYNNIVKSNKESPLYKISDMSSAKRYAIDVKENAKAIQNVVASLSDNYGEANDSFQKKVATSSDENTVLVNYVGDGREQNRANAFDIKIEKLASPQINKGNFLKDNAISIPAGSYSFDLNTNSSAYEFQYNVNPGDSNRKLLDKLANLINGSNLGIAAAVEENGEGSSALSLTSSQTGLSSTEDFLFSISPGPTIGSINAMDTLGINQVTQEASNSKFTLNGMEQTSLSNKFTVNNAFELTLLKENPADESTTISFKANTDAVADNIQTLVDAYNGILDLASKSAESTSVLGAKLLNDMSSVSINRKSSLEEIGLMVADDGSISIDRDILSDAVNPERAEDTFQRLTEFKDAIGSKADSAAIDPMKYVNKVVVEYKNPGKNFATPYISSIYSGMMLDHFA